MVLRIGILTFHWVPNYGAVCQAYALQRWLVRRGFNAEIIDYVPFLVVVKQALNNLRRRDLAAFLKAYRIHKFRKAHLHLSRERFFSNRQLRIRCRGYDVCICGSDQIWNQSFTLKAEGRKTLSYFLDFLGNDGERVAYAASFGSTCLPETMVELVKPELERFRAISVREATGVEILARMGLRARLVADPTLLLRREDYDRLLVGETGGTSGHLCSYILHGHQAAAVEVVHYLLRRHFRSVPVVSFDKAGVTEWLCGIKSSAFVVTNSFHGVIFCTIWHRPFIAVTVPGSGMNDRLATFLTHVGLASRLIDSCDSAVIDELVEANIDWDDVDDRVEKLRIDSGFYLTEALGEDSPSSGQ